MTRPEIEYNRHEVEEESWKKRLTFDDVKEDGLRQSLNYTEEIKLENHSPLYSTTSREIRQFIPKETKLITKKYNYFIRQLRIWKVVPIYHIPMYPKSASKLYGVTGEGLSLFVELIKRFHDDPKVLKTVDVRARVMSRDIMASLVSKLKDDLGENPLGNYLRAPSLEYTEDHPPKHLIDAFYSPYLQARRRANHVAQTDISIESPSDETAKLTKKLQNITLENINAIFSATNGLLSSIDTVNFLHMKVDPEVGDIFLRIYAWGIRTKDKNATMLYKQLEERATYRDFAKAVLTAKILMFKYSMPTLMSVIDKLKDNENTGNLFKQFKDNGWNIPEPIKRKKI